jgi:hypothetical protein
MELDGKVSLRRHGHGRPTACLNTDLLYTVLTIKKPV